MEELNTIQEDDDDILWELTTNQMREMAKKHRKPKVRTDLPPKDMTPRTKYHAKDIADIQPMTEMQSNYFAAYEQNPNKHFLITGSAGTGKTFLSAYLALKDIFDKTSPYERLIIVRSPVENGPGLGFLPGDMNEKIANYERPYSEICAELFGKATAYEHLKEAGVIEFVTTSFLRGCTTNDAIVLVDEMQNLEFGSLDTVITRVGYNSKIIFCGDYRQNDLLNKRNTRSGMGDFVAILNKMRNSFMKFEFGHDDIVRSGLVKEYIITKEKHQEQEAEVEDSFGTPIRG
jgi:phosphate starvation-inducible protein PhoH